MNTPPEPPVPTSGRGLILACEGVDDEQFLRRMLDHLQIRDVDVRRYNGKPQLPRFLLGLRDSTEFETVRALGILRDADTSATDTLRSVRDRLQRLQLPRPRRSGGFTTARCDFDGVIRTIGVFIMPDGQSSGELEDLCLRVVGGDVGLDCAQAFLECLQTRTSIACREQDRSKARLNTWLASRRDPTLRLGQAIAAGVLPADHPAFEPVRQFLTDLAAAASEASSPPA